MRPGWAGLLLAMALAAALRLVALDRLPPGLYHDEAFNGLDALRVLAGDRPVYFPANNGREPLYIYLIAPAIAWLGRTPGAVRLPAALTGTLTVAAAYGLAEALFDRRVAFFTAMITATTLWPVHLSRQGFRAVLLPLVIALTLWLGVRAWRSHRPGDWALTGGLYGLSFYTYLAARLTPLPLLVFAVYLALTDRLRRLWPGVLIAGAAALIVVMPLALYGLAHLELFLGRPMQVSIFNPAINGGDPLGLLARQIWQSLLMFTTHGTDEARHNLPGRPVFDPLMALAFLGGVALAFSRMIGWRRGGGELNSSVAVAAAFVLIWTMGMLAPTVLSEDAPHFLRAVGVMPLVFILPALALERLWRELAARVGHVPASAFTTALLIASTFLTLHDYFGPPYTTSTALYDTFDGPAAAISGPPLARFAQPIDLLRASVQPEETGTLRVRLLWAARGPIADDYTVFVHVMVGSALIAQGDGYPSSNLLPTSWWRPGDQVEDERVVIVPSGLSPGWTVEVGLYRLDTLERVPVLDEDGRPVGDKVQLP